MMELLRQECKASLNTTICFTFNFIQLLMTECVDFNNSLILCTELNKR